MKPNTITLIRHGESEGNINKKIYATKPDYALSLTPKGIAQAQEAGKNLHKMLGEQLPQFYVSPFWRTRETYREVSKAWGYVEKINSFWRTRETYREVSKAWGYVEKINYYEDPRLREQEWHGKLRPEGFDTDAEGERDTYGHFYYRFAGGESCADVFDRVSDFMNTLNRDFEKESFPRNCAIVTHGMTMRVFLMRWFHWSVEQFEKVANPHNCELIVLKKEDDRYVLVNDLREHKINHPYQFKW